MSKISITDVAYNILKKSDNIAKTGKNRGKHVIPFASLWKQVCEKQGYDKKRHDDYISDFYVALIQDSRFVYVEYKGKDQKGKWSLRREYTFDDYYKYQNPWITSKIKNYQEIIPKINPNVDSEKAIEIEMEEMALGEDNLNDEPDRDEDKRSKKEELQLYGVEETDSLDSDDLENKHTA